MPVHGLPLSDRVRLLVIRVVLRLDWRPERIQLQRPGGAYSGGFALHRHLWELERGAGALLDDGGFAFGRLDGACRCGFWGLADLHGECCAETRLHFFEPAGLLAPPPDESTCQHACDESGGKGKGRSPGGALYPVHTPHTRTEEDLKE